MQHEIDYVKIGQRIKIARQSKKLTQAELGAMVGCSNNHMSHIEVGQTKVSLPLLLKISIALGKEVDYFLLDTPYAKRESIVNNEIAYKLDQCNPTTLIAIRKMIDILLDIQKTTENA